MKRGGPLKRGTSQLKRTTPVKKVNRKRRKKAFVRNFLSDEYVEYTRNRPCLFCGGGPCITAHIRHARGMGGAHGTWQDTGPCCTSCDEVWENEGRDTLIAKRGLTWEKVEHRLTKHYEYWCMVQAA